MHLSSRQMADALGMGKSQVAELFRAGMPRTVDAARAWRDANIEATRSAGRIDRPSILQESPAEQASSNPESPDSLDDDLADPPDAAAGTPPPAAADANTTLYREQRATRERLRAEREQLELDQLRGRLIDLDEAKRLAFTAFRQLRDSVLNVPARIKDQCAAESDATRVEQLIDHELTAALDQFRPEHALHDAEDEDLDDT